MGSKKIATFLFEFPYFAINFDRGIIRFDMSNEKSLKELEDISDFLSETIKDYKKNVEKVEVKYLDLEALESAILTELGE